jgi:sialic acid synthase SpsE
LDCSAKGPDHAASADPLHFERYVKQIRDADRMRGTPGKLVLEIESDVRLVSRQSLVLRRDVRAGEILREEDLTVQRPGTGIPAAEIDRVVGRRVTRPMHAGSLLQIEMLSQAA